MRLQGQFRAGYFHPTLVFLLFGLTGTLAETGLMPQKLAEIGMWVFVYGLR